MAPPELKGAKAAIYRAFDIRGSAGVFAVTKASVVDWVWQPWTAMYLVDGSFP